MDFGKIAGIDLGIRGRSPGGFAEISCVVLNQGAGAGRGEGNFEILKKAGVVAVFVIKCRSGGCIWWGALGMVQWRPDWF